MVERSTRLKLRVSPGASRSEVVGRHGDAWKLRVAAPPDDGRANRAVLTLLAETLDVPADRVTLVSGGVARDKVVEIHGLDRPAAERLLTAGSRA